MLNGRLQRTVFSIWLHPVEQSQDSTGILEQVLTWPTKIIVFVLGIGFLKIFIILHFFT